MDVVLVINDFFMEITNGMIYQRLEDGEKRTDMRIEMLAMQLKDFRDETIRRFERIESQQMEDHRILMNLWEQRDNMKLSYTRTLLTMTGVISGVVAMIVSFITGKAIIYKG